jgi:hypothetical protein
MTLLHICDLASQKRFPIVRSTENRWAVDRCAYISPQAQESGRQLHRRVSTCVWVDAKVAHPSGHHGVGAWEPGGGRQPRSMVETSLSSIPISQSNRSSLLQWILGSQASRAQSIGGPGRGLFSCIWSRFSQRSHARDKRSRFWLRARDHRHESVEKRMNAIRRQTMVSWKRMVEDNEGYDNHTRKDGIPQRPRSGASKCAHTNQDIRPPLSCKVVILLQQQIRAAKIIIITIKIELLCSIVLVYTHCLDCPGRQKTFLPTHMPKDIEIKNSGLTKYVTLSYSRKLKPTQARCSRTPETSDGA